MGAPVRLCTDLAASSNSASTRIRTACRPFRFQGKGGYTGNVTIQNSTDGAMVSDADATWSDVGTLASGAGLTVDYPLTRVRVMGGHTGDPATVDMIESYY